MDQPTLAQYRSALKSKFSIRGVEPALELELEEVQDGGRSGGYESFALRFRGPGGRFVPQQAVPLTHPELGDIDMFLVPIGVDADGYRYEAVFNRMAGE